MPPLTLTPTPLSSLRLTTHLIPTHAFLPNTSTHPLIIYHAAFPPSTPPSLFETHLRSTALVPQWRYTMYMTTHYHSTTHEVLCVYRGRARLLFGGEENPGRVEVAVGAGDVLVVPAGVGHRLVEDLGGKGEGGFSMVGSYPRGCSWDMCYGTAEEEGAREAVKHVAWLEQDPVYGREGPAFWDGDELERRKRGKEGL